MSEENLHKDPLVRQLITQMNRVEGKVDGMQAALLTMARTEERVTQLMQSDNKKTEWILKLQDRVIDLEKQGFGSNAVSSRLERAAWVIITAMLTIFVGWLVTKGVAV